MANNLQGDESNESTAAKRIKNHFSMDLPVVLFFQIWQQMSPKKRAAASATINHTRFHSTGRSPSSVAVLH